MTRCLSSPGWFDGTVSTGPSQSRMAAEKLMPCLALLRSFLVRSQANFTLNKVPRFQNWRKWKIKILRPGGLRITPLPRSAIRHLVLTHINSPFAPRMRRTARKGRSPSSYPRGEILKSAPRRECRYRAWRALRRSPRRSAEGRRRRSDSPSPPKHRAAVSVPRR